MFKWVCIENAVSVVCFTVLAVIFDHWWIVLFSAFLCHLLSRQREKRRKGNTTMTNEQRKTAIEWLQQEIRSLRLAPKINGCGPENWADLLEIMETCLEAVRGHGYEPLTLEQIKKMKDQPVYLDLFDKTLESGWHIIKAVAKGKIFFRGWDTVYVPVDAIGKSYNLYAYHPAHIDREA